MEPQQQPRDQDQQQRDILYSKHRRSCDFYVGLLKSRLDLLKKDEQMIRDQFGKDKPLPPEWEDKIKRDRWAWEDDWGELGKELSRNDYDEKQYYHGNIKRQLAGQGVDIAPIKLGDLDLTPTENEDDPDRQRRQEWKELKDEQDAVNQYYSYSENRAPPAATQRRMAKQRQAFAERWNVTQRLLYASDEPTLSQVDLWTEARTHEDLLVAHYAVASHYESKHIPVPDTARDRMLSDCEDLFRQQEDYKREQDVKAENALVSQDQLANTTGGTEKENRFKEHLQSVREAHANYKPKVRH